MPAGGMPITIFAPVNLDDAARSDRGAVAVTTGNVA